MLMTKNILEHEKSFQQITLLKLYKTYLNGKTTTPLYKVDHVSMHTPTTP
jgi:hypothetical protein